MITTDFRIKNTKLAPRRADDAEENRGHDATCFCKGKRLQKREATSRSKRVRCRWTSSDDFFSHSQLRMKFTRDGGFLPDTTCWSSCCFRAQTSPAFRALSVGVVSKRRPAAGLRASVSSTRMQSAIECSQTRTARSCAKERA